MNHHVLLADLALRRSGSSFLPPVDAVVVDEAHDLEEAAAESLGGRLTSRGVAQTLSRLWNPRRGTGVLARVDDPGLRERVEAARRAGTDFFEAARRAFPPEGATGVAPIDRPLDADAAFEEALRSLSSGLEDGAGSAGDEGDALEIRARGRSVDSMVEAARSLREGPDDDHAAWAEWDPRGNGALLRAPVDVAPLLHEHLFSKFRTVVLTSATLSVGRPPSFRHLRDRLGLLDGRDLALGSPFDYARQARIVVRRDLPDPARDADAFEAALPEAVLDAVRRTKGGAFVLFTSYESMRRVATAVRAHLEGDGLQVLVQREGLPRSAMLDRFRAADSVLFGVSSFWQGVDVAGHALRNVVVTRLPFDVPTHPLHRAREARLVRAGRSPFSEMSLPAAALRLKQGVGRLVRTATDRGVVVILDPRVVTKRYGRTLLESLPECPVDVEPEAPDDVP
jgi:ATP-dependent DNA helicase DinG